MKNKIIDYVILTSSEKETLRIKVLDLLKSNAQWQLQGGAVFTCAYDSRTDNYDETWSQTMVKVDE